MGAESIIFCTHKVIRQVGNQEKAAYKNTKGVRQIADQPLNFVGVVPHLQCGTEKKGISNARLYTSALQLFSAKLNADERSAFCRTPKH